MNNKTIVRILIALVIVLAILNGTLLALMLLKKDRLSKRGHKGPEERAERLVDKLGFNDSQKSEFIQNAKEFRGQMDSKHQIIRKMRRDLMSYTRNTSQDSVAIDSIARSIGLAEAEILKNMIYHMQRQRALCKPEQLESFDAWHESLPGPPGRRPTPPGHRPRRH